MPKRNRRAAHLHKLSGQKKKRTTGPPNSSGDSASNAPLALYSSTLGSSISSRNPRDVSATTPQDVSSTTPQDASATTPPQDLTATTPPQDLSATTPQDVSATTPQDVSATTPRDLSAATPQDLSTSNLQDPSAPPGSADVGTSSSAQLPGDLDGEGPTSQSDMDFDPDEALLLDDDALIGEFIGDWVASLCREDVYSLSLLLFHVLRQEFLLQIYPASKLIAKYVNR
jgi:hypothetical protein